MAQGEEANRRGGAFLVLDVADRAWFSQCVVRAGGASIDIAEHSDVGAQQWPMITGVCVGVTVLIAAVLVVLRKRARMSQTDGVELLAPSTARSV
jgi:hypothetical protein